MVRQIFLPFETLATLYFRETSHIISCLKLFAQHSWQFYSILKAIFEKKTKFAYVDMFGNIKDCLLFLVQTC